MKSRIVRIAKAAKSFFFPYVFQPVHEDYGQVENIEESLPLGSLLSGSGQFIPTYIVTLLFRGYAYRIVTTDTSGIIVGSKCLLEYRNHRNLNKKPQIKNILHKSRGEKET